MIALFFVTRTLSVSLFQMNEPNGRHLKVFLNSLDQKLKILTNGKERVVSSLDKFEEGVKDVKQNLEKQSNAVIKNIMDYKKRLEEEFDQFVESEQNIL